MEKEIPTAVPSLEDYAKREITRPGIRAWHFAGWILALETASLLLAFLAEKGLPLAGISFFHERLGFPLTFFLGQAVVLLSTLRVTLILAVKLYQHYAPDHVRRRCCMIPTCSQYAILAIKKYGAWVGCYKTGIRLLRRCTGKEIVIDYP